jgi:hypothetical protein
MKTIEFTGHKELINKLDIIIEIINDLIKKTIQNNDRNQTSNRKQK